MMAVLDRSRRPRSVRTTDLAAYLLEHRLFRELPTGALSELAEAAIERVYRKGQCLCYAGDYPGYVFLVRSGLVVATVSDRDGNTCVVRTLSAGDIFALGAILLDLRLLLSATAMVDTEAILIHREVFQNLHLRCPRLAHQVIAELLRLLVQVERTVVRLTLTHPDSRLAAYLLQAATRTDNQSEASLCVDLWLSHHDLGRVLGVTRETISRTLTQFSRSGVVSIRGRHVVILKPEALTRLAQDYWSVVGLLAPKELPE